jgi:hypothetical protein
MSIGSSESPSAIDFTWLFSVMFRPSAFARFAGAPSNDVPLVASTSAMVERRPGLCMLCSLHRAIADRYPPTG